MSSKLSLKLNKDRFTDFVAKLQDLTNIEDTIKIKIEKDTTLIYTMLTNEVSVLALKNFTIKTSDYFENFDRDEMFDFVITSATKFVKNLKFFNSTTPIKLDIVYKPMPDDEEVMHIRTAQFSNGKLKINCIGGEQYKIKDIRKELLEQRLNLNNSKWSFTISNSDFLDVKKLSSIHNEDRTLNINVTKGVVTVLENSKWELHVDNIESPDNNLTFIKKYLSNIDTTKDEITFHIFETFILIKDEQSNLMLSFEQNFEDN